jgi:hypothetical protein
LIRTASDTPKHGHNLSRSRLPLVVTAITVAVLTAFGVFALPFFFPPSHPSFSAAYTAGFNNRVAGLAVALVSLLVLATAWRLNLYPPAPRDRDPHRIPLWLLIACISVCAVFTAWLSWILCEAQVSVIDSQYFLEAMDNVARYHQRIYVDFAFAYGPLLLYFPLAVHAMLAHFHVGIQGSYYVALALAECVGLVLLYCTLEALPLSRKIKLTTFCIFTIAALSPMLGMNYTLVRSLLPFSTMLFTARAKRPLALASLFLLGEILQMAVSPELGFAFAAGACFYALYLTLQKGPAWIPAIAAPPLAIALFLAVFGKPYLHSITVFSSGAFNLVLEPLGYVLLYLLSFVWLIPLMLARTLRENQPESWRMISLFIVCLALVPAAFSRCDLAHLFYDGGGAYLLAICALASYPKAARTLWFWALACTLCWMHIIGFLTKPEIAHAAAIVYRHAPRRDTIDISRLRTSVGNGKVFVPLPIPLNVEMQLKDSGLYLPDRDCFFQNVGDGYAEAAKVARMDANPWALIPVHRPRRQETPQNTSVDVGLGYSFYPVRRAPYTLGAILENDLKNHWTPAAHLGNWVLYHHNQTEATPGD